MMSDLFEKNPLKGVRHVLVVASGKGGVGKSPISANLAVSLARNGYKTALIDADIFGPSIPRMFGVEDESPTVGIMADEKKIVPVEKHGVKLLPLYSFLLDVLMRTNVSYSEQPFVCQNKCPIIHWPDIHFFKTSGTLFSLLKRKS